MGTVMTDLTRNAFITIYRMLDDRDRRVFTIYFAMEVRAEISRSLELDLHPCLD